MNGPRYFEICILLIERTSVSCLDQLWKWEAELSLMKGLASIMNDLSPVMLELGLIFLKILIHHHHHYGIAPCSLIQAGLLTSLSKRLQTWSTPWIQANPAKLAWHLYQKQAARIEQPFYFSGREDCKGQKHRAKHPRTPWIRASVWSIAPIILVYCYCHDKWLNI